MKAALIGEEVTFEVPAAPCTLMLIAGMVEDFLEAAGEEARDADKLDSDLRAALQALRSKNRAVESLSGRLVMTAEAVEIHLGPGPTPHLVVCPV